MIIHLLIAIVIVHMNTFVHSLGEPCVDHNKKDGVCMRISECYSLSLVHDLYMLQRDYLRHELLETDIISCNRTNSKRQLVVCCKDGQVQSKSIVLPTGKACATPKSNTSMYSSLTGVCSDIADCPPMLKEFQEKKKLKEGYEKYLDETIHESQRNCEKINQFICCPQDSQLESEAIPRTVELPTASLNPPECGKTKVLDANRIVGGSNALEGAWPWMALYGKGSSARPVFTCGGSIISKRHVMTAAHCLLDGTRKSLVRLGVHDISRNDSNVVDIIVAGSVSHEDFDNGDKHSDIAILTLIKEIVFTSLIAPICLPVDGSLRTESFLNTNPYIAGWGHTSENGVSSDIMQEASIQVVPNSQCEKGFKKEKSNFIPTARQFDKAVLCAGRDGGDSCQGDSGGPLMSLERDEKKQIIFYQIGIVSYGIGCGRLNVPGVYTSVQYFADWIKLHVEGKPTKV